MTDCIAIAGPSSGYSLSETRIGGADVKVKGRREGEKDGKENEMRGTRDATARQ
jgi:hypothetical protein